MNEADEMDAYTARIQALLATGPLPAAVIVHLAEKLTNQARRDETAAPTVRLADGITVSYEVPWASRNVAYKH